MTSVNCRIATPWVTALGSGDEVSFTLVRNHIDTCLYCQASIARQRRLRRSLEDLAVLPETSPVLGLPQQGGQRFSFRRRAALGAAGAALAVGVGVIGLRRALAH